MELLTIIHNALVTLDNDHNVDNLNRPQQRSRRSGRSSRRPDRFKQLAEELELVALGIRYTLFSS